MSQYGEAFGISLQKGTCEEPALWLVLGYILYNLESHDTEVDAKLIPVTFESGN
jgi:hypothetical protein